MGPQNTGTMEVYIGMTSEEFEQIFHIVQPSLLQLFKNEYKSRIALYIYLMRLRTNHTYAQMAPHFNMSELSICSRVRKVREIVYRDFVPLHLPASRDEIIRRTTPLSRQLFKVNDGIVILILDGTNLWLL